MGLCIEGDDDADVPVTTRLTLRCDNDAGHNGDPFDMRQQTFHHEDGFIGQYALAIAHGWKDTDRGQGRVFLCPACSGKAPK